MPREAANGEECQTSVVPAGGVDVPNGLSSEADPFTGPLAILSEYF